MKKQYIIVIVFLVIAAGVFFNNSFPPIKLFSSTVESIFLGPKGNLHGLITGSSSDSEEIKKLKAENEALSKKFIEYEKMKRDNEAFRSQFELATNTGYDFTPAKIVGFSGDFSSPSSFILDQGEDSGIKSGMAVVLNNKLVGKVEKVSHHAAQVSLVTSPSFSALAKTADGKGSGIARGNDDFILLNRVSVNDSLAKDGILLTSGNINEQGVGIPPDLEIGKIVSVNRSPSLPFQTAKVETGLNLGQLETVFIFTGLK